MKPYESLLESIRQRAFKECNFDLPERLSTFYEVYADVVKQAAENHKTGGIDALQYEAEKRLSKISCKSKPASCRLNRGLTVVT